MVDTPRNSNCVGLTLAFSCGARSAFKPSSKKLLEKHAIAPSAARLCSSAPDFRIQLAFCLATTGSAAKRLQSSVEVPGPIPITPPPRGLPLRQASGWFGGFKKEMSRERWPSAAARDQHSAEGIELLEKHAIAPSAARLCWPALRLNHSTDLISSRKNCLALLENDKRSIKNKINPCRRT
jgi:hypothetical protein